MATYRVSGTTSVTTTTSAFADLAQMSITFTPINPVVYVHFSAAGTYTPMGMPEKSIWLELRCNGALVKEFDFQSGSTWNQWFAPFSYPVNVVVGNPTTCLIRWATDGGTYTLFNNAGTDAYAHRSLVIYDQP